MKTIVARITGIASVVALGVGQAFAGHPPSFGRPRPPINHAPEIDPVQGLAALAILVCVGLVVREKFFREKPVSN